jgi:uncharacterized protein YecT (DUF1311 family)
MNHGSAPHRRLLICVVAAVAGAMAHAQTPPATSSHNIETERRPGCQENALAMARCEANLAEHSGDYLKDLVEKVKAALPFRERIPSFEKVQESWLTFREASCGFDSELAAGNSRGYRYAACTHSYNKARIALLEKYLSCLKANARMTFSSITLFRHASRSRSRYRHLTPRSSGRGGR